MGPDPRPEDYGLDELPPGFEIVDEELPSVEAAATEDEGLDELPEGFIVVDDEGLQMFEGAQRAAYAGDEMGAFGDLEAPPIPTPEGSFLDDIATLGGSGVGPAAGAGAAQASLGLIRGALRLPGDAARWGEALGESIDRITGERIPSWGNPGRWIQGAGEALAEGTYLPEGYQGGLNATAEAVGDIGKGLTKDYGPFRRLHEKGQAADAAVKTLLGSGDARGVLDVITDPEAVAGFIGNAAPSLGIAIASGQFGPTVQMATIAFMEGMEASENAAEFEKRTGLKVDPVDFMAAQGQMMTIGAALEKLGLETIMGGKGGFWRRFLGGGAGEGFTELGQNTNTNIATRQFINPEQDLSSGSLASFIGGAGTGAPAGALNYFAEPPVKTEAEIVEQAKKDAARILRGESLDFSMGAPIAPAAGGIRLNPGFTTSEHEVVMQPAPGGVELAPGELAPGPQTVLSEGEMAPPAGPYAQTGLLGSAMTAAFEPEVMPEAEAAPPPSLGSGQAPTSTALPEVSVSGTPAEEAPTSGVPSMPPPRRPSTSPIDVEKDDAVTILAKSGGLDRGDIGGEIDNSHFNTRIGIRSLFRRTGQGLSLDGAAELLRQYGFKTDGPNEVVSILRNWFAGNKTWSTHATAPYERQYQQYRDDQEAQQETETPSSEIPPLPPPPADGSAAPGGRAGTIGRDGQVDAFGRDETAQALTDLERQKDAARNGTTDVPLVQGDDELFANNGRLPPDFFADEGSQAETEPLPPPDEFGRQRVEYGEPTRLNKEGRDAAEKAIGLWTGGRWVPDTVEREQFLKGYVAGLESKDTSYNAARDGTRHPAWKLGKQMGGQDARGGLKGLKPAKAKPTEPQAPAGAGPNAPGKTRLDVASLTNEQLATLAKAVGFPEERFARLDLDVRRKTVVAMLQELEDKGLLDSSVLGKPAGYTGPERRQNAEQRRRVEQMSPEEMRRELLVDPLTNLGNRRAYEERTHLPVQVAVDADSLKWINDNMGHGAGDQLLREIGSVLDDAIGLLGLDDQHAVFHISGDEFVVEARSQEDAEAIVEKALELAADIEIEVTLPDGTQITKKGVGFSYGIGSTLEAADVALGEGKAKREAAGERAGRGQEPPGVARRPAEGQQDNEVQQEAEAVAPEPAAAAPEPAQEKTSAPEATQPAADARTELYGRLAGLDVTLRVEVDGNQVEIRRNAAEALREADNLVAALEEIREVC